MNNAEKPQAKVARKSKPPATRFSIAAIMWTTFALAAVLGYLRTFGLPTAGLGFAVMLATAAVAAVIGAVARQLQQAVFWGLLGAAFAFTCVIGATTMPVVMQAGWGMAGGVAGAVSGVVAVLKKDAPRWSVLAGAATGMVIIGGCCIYRGAFTTESIVDVLGAVIACGGLAIVIEVIRQIEKQFQTPRHRTAASLIFAVIAGNLVADWIMRSM